MFRFTDLIRGDETVREVRQQFPETAAVFERFGLRPSCDDCPIEYSARKVGASVEDLVVELNKVVHHKRGVTAWPEQRAENHV